MNVKLLINNNSAIPEELTWIKDARVNGWYSVRHALSDPHRCASLSQLKVSKAFC